MIRKFYIAMWLNIKTISTTAQTQIEKYWIIIIIIADIVHCTLYYFKGGHYLVKKFIYFLTF